MTFERTFDRIRDRLHALEQRQIAASTDQTVVEDTTAKLELVFANQIAGDQNPTEAGGIVESIYDTPWGGLIDPRVTDPYSDRSGVLALDWERLEFFGTYYNGWDLYSTWGDGPYLEWGAYEQYNAVSVAADESSANSRNDLNMVAFTPIDRILSTIYTGSRVWEYYDTDFDGDVTGSVAMAWHEQECIGSSTATRLDTCGHYLTCTGLDGDGESHLGVHYKGAQYWLRPRDGQSDDPLYGLLPMTVAKYTGSPELSLRNNGDVYIHDDQCGWVVYDRDDNTPKRIYVDSGVLSVEAV